MASRNKTPSMFAWVVAGLMIAVAGLAGGLAAYFYFFHTAK
jgi:hypothetical protein